MAENASPLFQMKIMGVESSPVTALQLKKLKQQAMIPSDALIRKVGDDDWVSADRIAWLSEVIELAKAPAPAAELALQPAESGGHPKSEPKPKQDPKPKPKADPWPTQTSRPDPLPRSPLDALDDEPSVSRPGGILPDPLIQARRKLDAERRALRQPPWVLPATVIAAVVAAFLVGFSFGRYTASPVFVAVANNPDAEPAAKDAKADGTKRRVVRGALAARTSAPTIDLDDPGFPGETATALRNVQLSGGIYELFQGDRGELQVGVVFKKSIQTDNKLELLLHIPMLAELSLVATDVTEKGLTRIAKSQLSLLDLSDSVKLTDESMGHLKVLKHLQKLCLARVPITNAGLREIQDLTTLESLNLSDTKIDDDGLSCLEGMVELKDLDLQGTKVTDAGLVRLKKLPQIAKLNLERTAVTEAAVSALKHALPNVAVLGP